MNKLEKKIQLQYRGISSELDPSKLSRTIIPGMVHLCDELRRYASIPNVDPDVAKEIVKQRKSPVIFSENYLSGLPESKLREVLAEQATGVAEKARGFVEFYKQVEQVEQINTKRSAERKNDKDKPTALEEKTNGNKRRTQYRGINPLLDPREIIPGIFRLCNEIQRYASEPDVDPEVAKVIVETRKSGDKFSTNHLSGLPESKLREVLAEKATAMAENAGKFVDIYKLIGKINKKRSAEQKNDPNKDKSTAKDRF